MRVKPKPGYTLAHIITTELVSAFYNYDEVNRIINAWKERLHFRRPTFTGAEEIDTEQSEKVLPIL